MHARVHECTRALNDRHCPDSEKVYTDNVDPKFVHGQKFRTRVASSDEEKETRLNMNGAS